MGAQRVKRRGSIRRYPLIEDATLGIYVAVVELPVDTAEYTIIVVDDADPPGVPMAFSLGYGEGSVERWPFVAGQSFVQEGLCLDAPHKVNVAADDEGFVVVESWGE